MRRASFAMGVGIACLFTLPACQEGTLFADNRANIAGAASVVDTAVVEPISVQELVNTINLAARADPKSPPVTLDDAIVNYESQQSASPPNNGRWAICATRCKTGY